MDTKSKKNPIAGYMGYVPSNQQEGIGQSGESLQESHIPGYVGYIPAVKSENMFGKTYGKITEECSKGNYSRGIELPKEVKYNSTTKSTFKDPISIKNQEFNEGKMNGVKLSTFSNAAKMMMSGSGGFGSQQYTQKKVTQMTYQDACRKAYI